MSVLKIYLLFTAIALCCGSLIAQGQSFSMGTKTKGIGFGNFKNYNGLRFNIWDKRVQSTNGLNLSVKSAAKVRNGMNIGLLYTEDSVNNGLSIGPAGFSERAAGVMAGIGIGGDRFSGIYIGGLVVANEKLDGLSVSAVTIADTIRGLAISGCGFFSRSDRKEGNVVGVSLAVYVSRLYSLKGINVALFNKIDHQKGLSIGAYNRTKKLKGVQIGLWNIAENKKHFRQMPLLNFNLKKT